MPPIEVQKNPPESLLAQMSVKTWAIWTKETSKFPWTYGDSETCYLREGEVVVTPEGGAPVRKHYRFG